MITSFGLEKAQFYHLEGQRTINRKYYNEMLQYKGKPAPINKREKRSSHTEKLS